MPLDALLDFPDDGGTPPRRPQAPPARPPIQRHYTAGRVIFSLIALPALVTFIGGAAWLWHVSSGALGAQDATLALSGAFLLALAVGRFIGQGIGGSLMLIGWGAFAALIWGVFGWAIWAIVGW